MVTDRKFLEIDRHPSFSYRPTAKDGDAFEGDNSSSHSFCIHKEDRQHDESCSLRQENISSLYADFGSGMARDEQNQVFV